MVDILGQFSGVGAGFVTGLKALIYIIPIVIIVIALIMYFRNRALYKHPVRIFRIRENGKHKEVNFMGGFINRQGSSPYFRIKTGRLPHQGIDLITTPQVKYMDEEDRVYYQQTDVNTFQQVRRYFDEDKNIHFTPIESDIRYGAILQTQRIKQLLAIEPTWKKVLPYFGLAICAVVYIVSYVLLLQNT